MIGYTSLNEIVSPGGAGNTPGMSHEELPPMTESQYTSARPCRAPGCDKPAKQKSTFCAMHDKRLSCFGTLDLPPKDSRTPRKPSSLRQPRPCSATTRVCTNCLQEQPFAAFARRRTEKIGFASRCRACVALLRRRDPEELARRRERDRLYRARLQDKSRIRARSILTQAVRRQKIARPALCSDCGGGGTIEAHHTDYSRPLDVVWLCQLCHAARH